MTPTVTIMTPRQKMEPRADDDDNDNNDSNYDPDADTMTALIRSPMAMKPTEMTSCLEMLQMMMMRQTSLP